METREIFESEIIHRLLFDKEYSSAVLPYLKPKYFTEDIGNANVFSAIKEHYIEYGEMANVKDIAVSIKDGDKESGKVSTEALIKAYSKDVDRVHIDLLTKKTEEFIKKAIFTEALITGAEGMQHHDSNKIKESFKLAEESQKVSLDDDFGTEVGDMDSCINHYQSIDVGLTTGIKSFDNVIGKGFLTKTLHTFLAPPGIGKSAAMAAFAVQFLKQKKDVVVASLEMGEEEWMKRIHANLLDIDIHLLEQIDPEVIKQKWEQIQPHIGTLIVKEYPSYTVTALQLKNYIEKYMVKKDIDKVILFIDYIGLMNSDRLPIGTNSYEYVKSITAEIRSVAQRLDITIFTAHQLNRCLSKDTELILNDKITSIEDIKEGDYIKGMLGDVKVIKKIKTYSQKVYKITLKSGKTIKVSRSHKFPTKFGMLSIDTGLRPGIDLETN